MREALPEEGKLQHLQAIMTSSFGATNVVVAVRTRPITAQEQDVSGGGALTLQMDANTTTLLDHAAGGKKKFTFDYNYWSIGAKDSPKFSSQERVFQDLAAPQLSHAMKGYNACVFAYGQTASGKTYTMMGPPSNTDHSTITASTGMPSPPPHSFLKTNGVLVL